MNKKCGYCDKVKVFPTDINNLYDNIIFFCDDQCLLDYCKEYANDSDSYEKEYDDPRMDLD